MHSGWLVEVASLWGYHGSTLVNGKNPLPVEAVNEYWLRNRIRFEGWNSLLNRLSAQTLSMSIGRRIQAWHKLRCLVEEILMAEPLARVSVAVAAQLEERQIDCDSHAILHNVFVSHCEVRNRCLKIILEGVDRGIEEADELNRLRHYLEHWTDMLLGYFANCKDAGEYAFSTTRVGNFAEDFHHRMLGRDAQLVWSLLLAACRDWLNKHCHLPGVSTQMNQRVCEAAMGMVHSRSFDSFGCVQSRLIQAIEYGIDHADETIDSLKSGSWESMSRVLSVDARNKPMRFEMRQ